MTDSRCSLLDTLADDSLKPVRWIKANRDHADAEFCLIWPFQCNDSGYAIFNGADGKKNIRVHRVMCEYKNGAAPDDKPDASHTCGRGHKACVNPHHIVWKSRSDNLKDVARHGERVKRFKLTTEQVDEIRVLQNRARTADIAEQFGVRINTIRDIWAGRIWKNTNAKYKQLAESDVRLIRNTPWQIKTARQFSAELGVPMTVIQRIRDGSTYKWVSAEAAE